MIATGLSWEDMLHPLYQKYKNHITWGDQDLLNIIFHYNPGKVPEPGSFETCARGSEREEGKEALGVTYRELIHQ